AGDEEDRAARRTTGGAAEVDATGALELEQRLFAWPQRAVDDFLTDEARGVALHARVGRLHVREVRRNVLGDGRRDRRDDKRDRERRGAPALAHRQCMTILVMFI